MVRIAFFEDITSMELVSLLWSSRLGGLTLSPNIAELGGTIS